MRPSPPLRFLVVVAGGWACMRTAVLATGWSFEAPPPPLPARPQEPPPVLAIEHHAAAGDGEAAPVLPAEPRPGVILRAAGVTPVSPLPHEPRYRPTKNPAASDEDLVWALVVPDTPLPELRRSPAPILAAGQSAAPALHAPPAPQPGRWSGSAWAFVRRGGVPQLAAGGTLGGSQAGARLLYRLNGDASRPLSISARAYSPLETKGAEAALGLEWQPFAAIPVRLLGERRQSLGAGGRSAFSLLAHGGVYEREVAGPVLLDAYAQAGLVGLRSRDLFADGSAQLSVPLGWKGRLKGGAGIWGAAQPGVSRLDAGPQASARFPIGGASLRVSADWRFRLAGDAEPGSGPALTIATEF